MSGLRWESTEATPTPVALPSGLPEAPRKRVRVEFGAESHVGKVRERNQDHYAIVRIGRTLDVVRSNLPEGDKPERVEDYGYAMVVADGMGGMAGGEKASVLAIRTGIRLVLESPKWALRIDEQETRLLIGRLREYFHQVDAALIRETEIDPSLAGMGTTLTVAYSVENHAFVVHAGDSRAYLLRNGELRRLTRDHTLAQSLADAGRIPPDSIEYHSSRHVLVNYAGGPRRGIEPEIGTTALEDGDLLLLCTDGLTGLVSDGEIVSVLQKHDHPEPAASALIQRALDRGGRDNVTAVLARYEISEA
jgi:protein phosphatase